MHEAMDNAEVFEDLSDSDMEEIDDGYSTSLKNVKPSLLHGQTKKEFEDLYLPALVELQKWISNIQHPNITMEQSGKLFKRILASQNVSGQSSEFEACLQPDHTLVTSAQPL
jgi:hypothetical protein